MTERRNLPTDDLLAYARAKARSVPKPGQKNQERLKMELLESTRRTFDEPQVVKRKVQVMNPRTPQSKVRDQQMSKKEFKESNLLGEDEALQDRMEQARAMRADLSRERLNQKQIPAQFSEVIHMRRKGPQNQDRRDQDGVKSPIYTEDLDNSAVVDDIDEEELDNLNINSDDEEVPIKPNLAKSSKNAKSTKSAKPAKSKKPIPDPDDDIDDNVDNFDDEDLPDTELDLDDLDEQVDDIEANLDAGGQEGDLNGDDLDNLEEEQPQESKKKSSPKKGRAKVYKKRK